MHLIFGMAEMLNFSFEPNLVSLEFPVSCGFFNFENRTYCNGQPPDLGIHSSAFMNVFPWKCSPCAWFSFFFWFLQLVQMRWRFPWRLVWMQHSMRLWNTSGLGMFLPSEWPSCRPPASLQNMPTSSASSSMFLIRIFPLQIVSVSTVSHVNFILSAVSSTVTMRPSPPNPWKTQAVALLLASTMCRM